MYGAQSSQTLRKQTAPLNQEEVNINKTSHHRSKQSRHLLFVNNPVQNSSPFFRLCVATLATATIAHATSLARLGYASGTSRARREHVSQHVRRGSHLRPVSAHAWRPSTVQQLATDTTQRRQRPAEAPRRRRRPKPPPAMPGAPAAGRHAAGRRAGVPRQRHAHWRPARRHAASVATRPLIGGAGTRAADLRFLLRRPVDGLLRWRRRARGPHARAPFWV